MESTTTPTPTQDKQVTVEVPEDRVPEFYAWYARFLAGGPGRRGRGRGPGRHGRHGHGPHGRHCHGRHGERQETETTTGTTPAQGESPTVV